MKFNDPTPKYTTQPNGDVTIEWLPPTALMMTAHREMEKLTEVIGGQGRTIQTMTEHINFLEAHIQNLDNTIHELTSPKPTNGNRTNSGSTSPTSSGTGEPESAGT
jgi:hypothetical protein